MGEKYALIIAVEEYYDYRFDPVKFAQADALAILSSLKLHGYTNIEYLINNDATQAIVKSKIKYYARTAVNGDDLIIYYAGHGFSEGGNNYITCYDTQFDDKKHTSVDLRYVLDQLNQSFCERKIIFLDSCHSGVQADANSRGIYSNLSTQEIQELLKDSKYCVGFASCRDDEESYSTPQLNHGIWSHHVIQALLGQAKEALANGHLITGISLQNYLSREVPRSVRRHLTGNKTQTPCAFGNITGDFVIADVSPILEASKSKAKPNVKQLKRALFSRVEIGSVKSLSGFIKGRHRIPDGVNRSTESFVAGIAGKELNEQKEELFQEIRSAFNYKRRDMDIEEDEGKVSIIGPDFDLDIIICQNPEEPSEYLWRVELNNIRNPNVIETEEFNNIFINMFDTLEMTFKDEIQVENLIDFIEDLEDERITVEYPVDCESCTISLQGVDAKIEVDLGSVRLVHRRTRKPIEMVKNLFKSQELLSKTQAVKLLPFGSE